MSFSPGVGGRAAGTRDHQAEEERRLYEPEDVIGKISPSAPTVSPDSPQTSDGSPAFDMSFVQAVCCDVKELGTDHMGGEGGNVK